MVRLHFIHILTVLFLAIPALASEPTECTGESCSSCPKCTCGPGSCSFTVKAERGVCQAIISDPLGSLKMQAATLSPGATTQQTATSSDTNDIIYCVNPSFASSGPDAILNRGNTNDCEATLKTRPARIAAVNVLADGSAIGKVGIEFHVYAGMYPLTQLEVQNGSFSATVIKPTLSAAELTPFFNGTYYSVVAYPLLERCNADDPNSSNLSDKSKRWKLLTPLTLKSTCQPPPWTVRVEVSPPNSGTVTGTGINCTNYTGPDCSETIPSTTTQVSLLANAMAGYYFKWWEYTAPLSCIGKASGGIMEMPLSDSSTCQAAPTTPMTTAGSIRAVFAADPQITATLTGGGGGKIALVYSGTAGGSLTCLKLPSEFTKTCSRPFDPVGVTSLTATITADSGSYISASSCDGTTPSGNPRSCAITLTPAASMLVSATLGIISCVPQGMACSSATTCCNGLSCSGGFCGGSCPAGQTMVNGVCTSTIEPTCRFLNLACSNNADCCSGNCSLGICR